MEQAYDSRPDTWEHIHTVRVMLGKVIRDLMDRADLHDQTKLRDREKAAFDEYTPKLKGSTYGSEEYSENLKGLGSALEHHYIWNDHHPEHFIARDKADGYFSFEPFSRDEMTPLAGVQAMNLVQIVEMLCDWKAASMRHADGDIRKSIEINQARFGYSDEIKQLLLNTLPLLEKGHVAKGPLYIPSGPVDEPRPAAISEPDFGAEGFERVQHPEDATHIYSPQTGIKALPCAYPRSLELRWLRKLGTA